jgi:hypothetical protein
MKKEPFGSFFVLVFKGTNSFIILTALCLRVNLSFSLACFFKGTISFINPMLCFFMGET